jgi:uncharacterized damage-inducible protein DinB
MKWTELLNEGIEDNFRITDRLMALVEDGDLNWKPATGKNWMTIGQLLNHLTNACGFCCRAFATGDWGPPDGIEPAGTPEDDLLPPAEGLPTVASVAEARAALARDRELALAMVREVGEERLDSEMVAAPWEPSTPHPLGWHFLSMVLHLMQHKGQLFYYLKLMDRDVNTAHLWGV